MTHSIAHRILLSSFLLLIPAAAPAGDPAKTGAPTGPAKTTINDVYHPILINNVFNYYSNNGDGSYNRFSSSNEGFEWPKGNGTSALMFEDGIVWGCKQSGGLKIGGSVYRHGLQAGPIVVNGTPSTPPVADDPSAPGNRVYRVRRDIPPIAGVTNPDDPLATEERAIILRDEVYLIGRYEAVSAQQILLQYWSDWATWPAAQGAPYADVDHNGVYDPAIDIPGYPLADQTIWYAANDMDMSRTTYLAGSAPIGLEMQKTIWAYNLPGALGNAIFARTKLINKSGVQLDTMYLGQWSDPDLGDASDDFVGCDTLLNLGYAYNSKNTDADLGLAPPAVGFDLLQGPVVPGAPTDTAIVGGARRVGFRNLPMCAFVFFMPNAMWADPTQGPGGDIQWYRLLKGTVAATGSSFVNPVTGQPTVMTLSGDPVAGTGWIDGNPAPAADRRMLISSGPFTMAPGDTEEIVAACLVSRGGDNLSSITALKSDDKLIQQLHNSLNTKFPPRLSCAVAEASGQATLSFRADARALGISAVQISLKTYGDAPVGAVALADDGLHGDGAAGDGIWGGSAQITQQQTGVQAGAVVSYAGGEVIAWAHMLDDISTAKVTVTAHAIVSDNLNNDGIPNPAENVRYLFSLTNSSSLTFTNLSVRAVSVSAEQQLGIASLAGGSTFSLAYDQYAPGSYFAFDVPAGYVDSTLLVVLVTSDGNHNQWRDTLAFPVRPLARRLYSTPLAHPAGKSTGDFAVAIIDSSQVKNHLYVIRGIDTTGFNAGYTLKDSTAGTVLIGRHPLPDPLGHTSPIVDGLKVRLGTVDILPGMKGWSIPSGTRRFSSVNGYPGLGLEGFTSGGIPDAPQDRASGTIGMGANLSVGPIYSNLPSSGYHTVLLKLAAVDNVALWNPLVAPADTNYSRAYRWLRSVPTGGTAADPSFAPWIVNRGSGYVYQDYNYGVPFSAWDMETVPPTRLSVGMFENNVVGGRIDGRYWPVDALGTVDNSIAREFCYIFGTPYSPSTPNPALSIANLQNASVPMMWVMACARRSDVPWVPGDQFLIIANHLPSSEDIWTFTPSVMTGVRPEGLPASFALRQNYPNPFNPSTTIRYELAAPGRVTMKIYNLLGQEIRTLLDEMRDAGQHALTWNARNDAGSGVASGVYFYRCSIVPLRGGSSITQTMKMLLVR